MKVCDYETPINIVIGGLHKRGALIQISRCKAQLGCFKWRRDEIYGQLSYMVPKLDLEQTFEG